MSVNVPIGKGIVKTTTELKFPDIKLAQPEFTKESVDQTSNLEFNQKLLESGNFIRTVRRTLSDAGTIDSITPPVGTTFYFLRALMENNSTMDTVTFNIGQVHSISGAGSSIYQRRVAPETQLIIEDFPLRVVGGVEPSRLNFNTNSDESAACVIWGYTANTTTTNLVRDNP